MTTLAWFLAAAVASFVAAIVVALAVGRILGQIGADVTHLLEAEEWSAAPLTRAVDSDEPVQQEHAAAQARHRRA
jgi:hypothetical protein